MEIYRVKKSKNAVLNDEEKGIIPQAKREERGTVKVRVWEEKQLVEIGKQYSFIKIENAPRIITVYSPKGGVMKSTIAFNVARIMALNGVKVLAIGLEVTQKTLTKNLEKPVEINSLEEADQNREIGLWEVAKDNLNVEKAIKHTSLPTLDYIPETSNLGLLDEHIEKVNRREYFLERLLKPIYNKYDVVILDNSSWGRSQLVKNSLCMATDIICPFACELESFRSVVEGVEAINNFKRDMGLKWQSFRIVPTLRDNSLLSSQIEAYYRSTFGKVVTSTTLHRYKAAAEESGIEQLSVIESNNKSPLAHDYYDLMVELYGKNTDSE